MSTTLFTSLTKAKNKHQNREKLVSQWEKDPSVFLKDALCHLCSRGQLAQVILVLCPKLVTDLGTQPHCTVFCEITQGKLISGNLKQYCQELPVVQQLSSVTSCKVEDTLLS